MKRKTKILGVVGIFSVIFTGIIVGEWLERKTRLDSENISVEEENQNREKKQQTTKAAQTQSTVVEEKEPNEDEFVLVSDYIPDIVVDLKYSTEDNFTGSVIYDFSDAYLRYGTVKKLSVAQAKLKEMGYYIKIWDAYRPFAAQEKLWEVCPNPIYVANPANGMKAHNLGGTMDITLVTLGGEKVEMPTEFDDFSTLADRDYSDVGNEAANNAKMLEKVMYECGFVGYSGEWWDYSDTVEYAPVDFIPPN